MRGAARYEMEYLDTRGRNGKDTKLAQELGRRLEALRRNDQLFCDADCRPNTRRLAAQPQSKHAAD
jgi:hypothetical protein